MQSLTPPTDNLYKFIAISGLLLFFSSGYLNYSLSKNSFNKLSEHYVDFQLSEFKREKFIEQSEKSLDESTKLAKLVSEHNQMLDSLIKNNNSGKLSKDVKENSRKFVEKAENQLDKSIMRSNDLEDQAAKLEEENIKLRGEHTRMSVESDVIKLTKKFSYFGLVLGLLISSIGFYYWYTKVQIFLDYKIKSEYDESVGSLPNNDTVIKAKTKDSPIKKENFKPEK